MGEASVSVENKLSRCLDRLVALERRGIEPKVLCSRLGVRRDSYKIAAFPLDPSRWLSIAVRRERPTRMQLIGRERIFVGVCDRVGRFLSSAAREVVSTPRVSSHLYRSVVACAAADYLPRRPISAPSRRECLPCYPE